MTVVKGVGSGFGVSVGVGVAGISRGPYLLLHKLADLSLAFVKLAIWLFFALAFSFLFFLTSDISLSKLLHTVNFELTLVPTPTRYRFFSIRQ